jgi:hypothetical protein
MINIFLFRLRQFVGGLWFESIKECGSSVCITFQERFILRLCIMFRSPYDGNIQCMRTNDK